MEDVIVVRVESWVDSDYCTHDNLKVNDKAVFDVHPLCECPEDAIIGRDLISCGEIANFLESFLRENQGKKVKFEHEEITKEDE